MQIRRIFGSMVGAVVVGAAVLMGHGISAQTAAPAVPAEAAYVHSAFTGNGEDGLHLLTSRDGKTWQNVKGFQSIYKQADGLMRDPSICRGGDGKYHMVWTTGWWDATIAVAHSDNLLDWSPMQKLYVWADYRGPGEEQADPARWPADLGKPAERNAKVRNCWAPEIFYDDQTKEYVIFWSTTIDDPKIFAKTWDARRWERTNHRAYYVTTKDFRTYTPRKFFYAPEDREVIDACISKVGPGDYRMVIKDEIHQRLHVCFPTKKLTTWAEMPADFWGPMSAEAFTGSGIQPDNTQAEGPSVYKVGDEWFITCDYWNAGKNGLFSTRDFKAMTRLNDQMKSPQWIRHGTVIAVPAAVVETLEKAK